MCLYVYVYVCMYIYIYIYIYPSRAVVNMIIVRHTLVHVLFPPQEVRMNPQLFKSIFTNTLINSLKSH